MRLTGLIPPLLTDPAFAQAVAAAEHGGERTVSIPLGVRAALVAAMTSDGAPDRPVVVVTATGREADDAAAALRNFFPDDDVAVLPAWETLPHERLSPRSDTVARRIAVFRRLAHPGVGRTGPIRVLVVPVRALLQPVVTGLGDLEPVELEVGQEHDLEDVATALTAAAYTRVDMVESRGQFAVRGGILDVFPPTEAHPMRVEFWGDTVEEIRWFSVADQRSLDVADRGLWAPPAREILLTSAVRARARALMDDLPGARDMLERLGEGIAVEGMESLAPLLVDGMEPVLSLVPDKSLVLLSEPERIRRRAHDLVATTEEFLAAASASTAAGGQRPLDVSSASFATLEDTRDLALARRLGWWGLTSLSVALPDDAAASGTGADGAMAADDGEPADDDAAPAGTVAARDVEPYRGDIVRALADLRALTRDGWRLLITTQGAGPARRM